MHKRLLTILTTITLSTALLVGCGNKQEEIPQATIEESAPEQTEEGTTPPTEIAEQTPETTTEPVEEATTEPETEPTETVEPAEQTDVSTPEPVPQYTYTDMSATMYAQQTVNVRDLPDTSGNKLGSLSTNDEIKISGQCNETSWYRFEYNGSVAYVSNKYVSENKVEIQQAPTDNSGGGQAPSTPASNYQTGVWYDMGDYYFFIPNSENEFWNHFNNCDDIRSTLQARYPDRNTYVSSDASGSILIVSALHRNEKGFPNWSEINYIPELGMN